MEKINIETHYCNTKMVIFVDVTIENIKEHNPNWSQIPDYPYGLLITGGSGLLKTHALLNLINL